MYVVGFRAKVKVLLNRFNLGWNTDVQVLTLIETALKIIVDIKADFRYSDDW